MSVTYENEFPTLMVNQKFILREHHNEDVDAFFEYYSNKNVAKHILANPVTSRSQAESEIFYCRNLFRFKRGIYWTLAVRSTNTMIGAVGITINNLNHRGEIHYDLSEEYWGQGIMSTAIKKCSEYGLSTMGLYRIEAITVPENIASHQVLLKNGYRHEGRLKNYKYFHNKPIDIDMFAITPDSLEK